MKKILQAVILFLIPFCFFAQNNQNNITISFSNNSLEEVINKLETTSSCTFFYDIEWIQKSNNVISGEYTNTTINRVLDDILKSTNLNYFIDGKRVIFTKNALIIDKLDDNFFNANNTSLTTDRNDIKVEPVFNKQYTATTQGKSEALNSIGKQNSNADQKIYILSGYVYDTQSEKTVPNINIKIAGSETSTHTQMQTVFIQ